MPKACLECDKALHLRCRRDLTRKKFCSHACRSRYLGRQRDMAVMWAKCNLPEVNARKGRPNPNRIPVGGKTFTSQGYIKVRMPDGSWEYEHRIVAKAGPGQVTHHRNGMKDDNRPENLQVLSKSEHSKIHAPREVPRHVSIPHA